MGVTSTMGMAARRRLSRVPWRSGWHLTPSYGERLGGGAVRPLCRGLASSEAEMSYPLEGRFATLERGGDEGRSSRVPMGALERSGDRPAGPEWGANGLHVGLLLSPFLSSRLEGGWAFVGPVA